jgi:hypothetical protein
MCTPKSIIPQTGYWDFNYACDNPWATPPESCDAYEGQKGGKAINDVPYPNGGEFQTSICIVMRHDSFTNENIPYLHTRLSWPNRCGRMLLVGSWSYSNVWSMVSCLEPDLPFC